MPITNKLVRYAGIGLWTVGVLAGLGWQFAYDLTPGASGPSPQNISEIHGLVQNTDHPVLLMGLHPRCPCSRASIKVFGRLVELLPAGTEFIVLMSMPQSPDPEWSRAAAALTQDLGAAHVVEDPGGARGAAIGMRTSGAVLYYATDGRLRYSGGPTSGRGVGGNGAPPKALMDVINHDRSEIVTTPVFGCGLTGDAGRCGPSEGCGS